MKIYIGADHRGFHLKETIKQLLSSKSIPFEDVGNTVLDPSDDYPVFTKKVAFKVQNDKQSLGIVVCGSGVGVDIAANKIDGIRSALVANQKQVQVAREDDNVNVLALASDFVKPADVPMLIEAFINTKYIPSEKHERRLGEITNLEHEV